MTQSNGAVALRFIAGRFRGGELPLARDGEILIGRDGSLEVVLDEEGVSRQHARITTHAGHVHIRDLASTNGTFVNGQRIDSMELKLGDKILIGRSIMMLVPDPGGAPPDALQ
ncbi:MAG: FHA domain-containing protein [Myxococcota bacterium]